MSKQRQPADTEPTVSQRAADYCRTGEDAAYYLHGLADAIELLNDGGPVSDLLHHLRHHAHELMMGTLWWSMVQGAHEGG
jgi:hypothetical protein